ncbi:MAG: hypothetical protein ABSA79_08590 [Candidatus Bathyarchaeia archaeon]|jgi:protein-disulfide isomerase
MSSKMQIDILSASCCNPSLAPLDQQYKVKIREVLAKAKIDAELELLTFTTAIYSPKAEYLRKLQPLLNKYGMDVMPALFINRELVLYGGVPSIEKLTEVIQKAINPATPTQNRI